MTHTPWNACTAHLQHLHSMHNPYKTSRAHANKPSCTQQRPIPPAGGTLKGQTEPSSTKPFPLHHHQGLSQWHHPPSEATWANPLHKTNINTPMSIPIPTPTHKKNTTSFTTSSSSKSEQHNFTPCSSSPIHSHSNIWPDLISCIASTLLQTSYNQPNNNYNLK